MRKVTIKRKTNETDISLTLNVDGKGESYIDSGCGFLDHMLTLFSNHGHFDLELKCIGDTYVDDHHTVEDIGIALGLAFQEAIGDKKGINRYGSMILPMDEALTLVSIDVSGRTYLNYGLNIPSKKVGTFDTELVEEFFYGFVRNFPISLHIKQLDGSNSHHIIEVSFKSFGRALKEALRIDEEYKDEIPSTKGSL